MNRILKKSLSVFLAVVMMVSAVPLGGFVGIELPGLSKIVSYAADEQEIKLNETKTVNVSAGGMVYLKFNPEIRGTYIFYSTGSSDTYGYLYDANKKSITSNNNISDSNKNFRISYELKSGRTYYWGVKFNSSSTSGNITVKLEMQCEHIYQKEITREATCTQTGEAVYTCSVCNYSYIDKLPRHIDDDNDGMCDQCGESTKTVLESGSCNNNIEWLLYGDGELEIIGSGEMPNYTCSKNIFSSSVSYSHPWTSYSSQIKVVNISEGITSIGNYCFGKFTSLENINIPSTVAFIGTGAFLDCTNLNKICILNTDTVLNEYTFGYYTSGTIFSSTYNKISYDNRQIYGIIDSNAHSYAKDNNITFYCYHGFNGADCFTTEIEPTPCGDIVRLTCTQCNQIWLDVSAVVHDYELSRSVCDCINGGKDTYVCSRCNDTYTVDFAARHADADDDGYCDYCNTPFGGVLDLVFVIDVTGSMSGEISVVKNSILSYADMLSKSNIPHYISLIEYSNKCENGYYNVIFDLTDNDEIIQRTITNFSMRNGASEPVYTTIIDGLSDLHWGINSARRVILIGDEDPNGDKSSHDYGSALSALNENNVSVYSIATGGADLTEFKNLAKDTNGQYYQSTDAEDFSDTLIDIIDSIPDTIHLHDYIETVITASTCTKTGVSSYVCSGCGKQLNNTVVEALGHNYESEHFEATDEKESHTVYTCSRCSDSYTVLDPAAPVENFIAFSGTYKINLSWLKAVEASVTGYEIYRKTATEEQFTLLKKITSRDTLSYVDNNLVEGTEYSYKIRAMKGNIEGDFSDVVTAIPNYDTENPTITSLEPKVANAAYSKNVTITAKAEDDIGVKKIELYGSTDNGQNWNLIYASNNKTLTYSLDTTRYPDGLFSFKVVAYDEKQNKSQDNIIRSFMIDNTGPQKVTGFNVDTVTQKSVLLKWNDVADDDRVSFVIEKKVDGTYTVLKNNIRTIGVSITNLSPNTSYTLRIAAVDACGNIGGYSDDLTFNTEADITPPIISNLLPTPSRYSSKIPFVATAKDDVEIVNIKIQYSFDGVEWHDYSNKSFSGVESATYSENVNINNFDEGSVYLRAIATDASGNMSKTDNTAPFVEYIVDKTAPEAPSKVTAIAKNGYITIAWEQGKETDLSTYSLYRSVNADSGYTCIASGIKAINYNDTSAKNNIIYYYKVCVKDIAGNVSDYSEIVSSSTLADTINPTVKISPADGSIAGPKAYSIVVSATDNNLLSSVKVEYMLNNTNNWQTLASYSNISAATKQYNLSLPINNFNDSDVVTVRAISTDEAGLSSDYALVKYTVDKLAPVLSNEALSIDDDILTLSWKSTSSDIKGFMVYYSLNSGNYTHIKTVSPTKSNTYNLNIDVSSYKAGTYKIKLEAYDNAGNVVSYEYDSFVLERVVAPTAKITAPNEIEESVQEIFDASSSFDADGNIVLYEWDFGDGTKSNSVKAVKSYTQEGTYAITLTVTDNEGNQDSTIKHIKVIKREQFGQVKVIVTDTNGKLLPGISIKIDGNDSMHQYTNNSGVTIIKASAGLHNVSAYLDNAYLPAIKSVSVLAGTTSDIKFVLTEGSVIEGKFTVTRLNLDEIKELQEQGFDVNAEANTQYYKSKVTLSYGTKEVEISTNYDSNYNVINWNYSLPSTPIDVPTPPSSTMIDIPYIPKSVSVWSDTSGNEYIGVVSISAGTKFLKELFDVRLDIFCNASGEFEVVNSTVSLDLPEGLSLLSGYDGYENESIVNIPSIKGGSNTPTTLNWLVRGDLEGEYELNADFIGSISPINEIITAHFKTDENIVVYGASAAKTVYNVASSFCNGKLFFNLGIENIRDVDLYYPDVSFDEETLTEFAELYKKTYNGQELDISKLKVYVKGMYLVEPSGSMVEIDEFPETLHPGQAVFQKYIFEGLSNYVHVRQFNEAVVDCYSAQENVEVEVNLLSYDNEIFKHEIVNAFVESDTISQKYDSSIRFAEGEKFQLKIRVMWDNGFFEDYNEPATWFSSDTTVASVNNKGLATAIKEGEAYISCVLDSGIESLEHRFYVGDYDPYSDGYTDDSKDGHSGHIYLSGSNFKYWYSDEFFDKDSDKLNFGLLKMSLYLELSSWVEDGPPYEDPQALDLLKNIGFKDAKAYGYDTRPDINTIAATIGHKNLPDKDTSIVAIAIRGGGYEAEWGGNFNVGSSGDHAGFTIAKEKVLDYLETYLASHEQLHKRVIFWVVGYSRAAATANLLAADLNRGANGYKNISNYKPCKANVYAYTFATPQGTVNSNAHSSKYNNIINVVNPIDPVPYVAPEIWSFTRYGVTYYLPAKEYVGNYDKVKNVMSATLKPYYGEYIEDFVFYELTLGLPPMQESKGNHGQSAFLKGFWNTVFANDIVGGRRAYVNNYQATMEKLISIFLGKNTEAAAGVNVEFFDSIDELLTDIVLGKVKKAASLTTLTGLLNIYYPGVFNYSDISNMVNLIFAALGNGVRHPNYTWTLIKSFGSEAKYKENVALMYTHHPEIYVAWLETKFSDQWLFTSLSYRDTIIKCPVDVNVYDADNKLVASIIDDEPVQLDGKTICYYVDEDGQKHIILPSDASYTIEIKARDNGTVTYRVREISIDKQTPDRVITYYDIPIKETDSLICNAENIIEVPDITYTLRKVGSTELYTPEILIGEDVETFTASIIVDDSIKDDVFVYGGGEISKGEYCKLMADSAVYDFVGWYIDGDLISTNNEEKIVVTGNVEIEARFSDHTYDCTTVPPTCTADGYTNYTCSICGDTYSEVISALDHSYSTDWTIDKDSTCKEEGSKSHHCTRCDSKADVTVIAKKEHTYVHSVVAPTCTTDGYTSHTCSLCGTSYTDAVTSKTGHCDNNGDGKCDNCKVDLGTHQPDDPSSKCSCKCHKSGIVKFFWKLINFFHKLFKMEKYHYCDCGNPHW